MTEPIFGTDLTGTRDGLTQLQRYWRPPPGEAKAAVLVVHGVAEHSGRYDALGRFLATRGFDVLAFDARGHGQSGGRRGHVDRFDEYLDDLEDLVVERRQLDLPVVLLGHSLGGLVSVAYVAGGRPRPDLLVLSAPAIRATVAWWRRVGARLLSGVAPRLAVPTGIDPQLVSRDPDVQRAYADDPLRVRAVTARLGQEMFTTMDQVAASIDKITMPTYVIGGSADQVVPTDATAPLANQPNVTYRLWDDLRHECFNEPEAVDVMTEVATWLDTELATLGLRG